MISTVIITLQPTDKIISRPASFHSIWSSLNIVNVHVNRPSLQLYCHISTIHSVGQYSCLVIQGAIFGGLLCWPPFTKDPPPCWPSSKIWRWFRTKQLLQGNMRLHFAGFFFSKARSGKPSMEELYGQLMSKPSFMYSVSLGTMIVWILVFYPFD